MAVGYLPISETRVRMFDNARELMHHFNFRQTDRSDSATQFLNKRENEIVCLPNRLLESEVALIELKGAVDQGVQTDKEQVQHHNHESSFDVISLPNQESVKKEKPKFAFDQLEGMDDMLLDGIDGEYSVTKYRRFNE